MLATIMMTLGFLLMVYPQGGIKVLLPLWIAGLVLREVFHVTYESNDAMDHLMAQIDKIN